MIYFDAAPGLILIQDAVCSPEQVSKDTSHSAGCLRGTGLSLFFFFSDNDK